MTKDELIEALAAIEHERWADWQKYLHSKLAPLRVNNNDAEPSYYTIDPEWIERWKRQINTPYADLSEREKASDREQVARYWPLLVEFFTKWLEANGRPLVAYEFRKEVSS